MIQQQRKWERESENCEQFDNVTYLGSAQANGIYGHSHLQDSLRRLANTVRSSPFSSSSSAASPPPPPSTAGAAGVTGAHPNTLTRISLALREQCLTLSLPPPNPAVHSLLLIDISYAGELAAHRSTSATSPSSAASSPPPSSLHRRIATALAQSPSQQQQQQQQQKQQQQEQERAEFVAGFILLGVNRLTGCPAHVHAFSFAGEQQARSFVTRLNTRLARQPDILARLQSIEQRLLKKWLIQPSELTAATITATSSFTSSPSKNTGNANDKAATSEGVYGRTSVAVSGVTPGGGGTVNRRLRRVFSEYQKNSGNHSLGNTAAAAAVMQNQRRGSEHQGMTGAADTTTPRILPSEVRRLNFAEPVSNARNNDAVVYHNSNTINNKNNNINMKKTINNGSSHKHGNEFDWLAESMPSPSLSNHLAAVKKQAFSKKYPVKDYEN